MTSKHDDWLEVEQALGNKGRLRILRSLFASRPLGLTRYRLSRETGLNQSEVKRNLEVLVRLRWVLEESLVPTTYVLNLENRFVKKLGCFFEGLDLG